MAIGFLILTIIAFSIGSSFGGVLGGIIAVIILWHCLEDKKKIPDNKPVYNAPRFDRVKYLKDKKEADAALYRRYGALALPYITN